MAYTSWRLELRKGCLSTMKNELRKMKLTVIVLVTNVAEWKHCLSISQDIPFIFDNKVDRYCFHSTVKVVYSTDEVITCLGELCVKQLHIQFRGGAGLIG